MTNRAIFGLLLSALVAVAGCGRLPPLNGDGNAARQSASDVYREVRSGKLAGAARGGRRLSADQYVTTAYNIYLGRSPTADETAFWQGLLVNGTSSEELRAALLAHLSALPEFTPRGGLAGAFVTYLYWAYLGRYPSADEIPIWLPYLQEGTMEQFEFVAERIWNSAEAAAFRARTS